MQRQSNKTDKGYDSHVNKKIITSNTTNTYKSTNILIYTYVIVYFILYKTTHTDTSVVSVLPILT